MIPRFLFYPDVVWYLRLTTTEEDALCDVITSYYDVDLGVQKRSESALRVVP